MVLDHELYIIQPRIKFNVSDEIGPSPHIKHISMHNILVVYHPFLFHFFYFCFVLFAFVPRPLPDAGPLNRRSINMRDGWTPRNREPPPVDRRQNPPCTFTLSLSNELIVFPPSPPSREPDEGEREKKRSRENCYKMTPWDTLRSFTHAYVSVSRWISLARGRSLSIIKILIVYIMMLFVRSSLISCFHDPGISSRSCKSLHQRKRFISNSQNWKLGTFALWWDFEFNLQKKN